MKKTIIRLAMAAAIFAAGYFLRRAGPEFETTLTRIDTLVVRDTIREPVPVPVERRIVRVDTVWVGMPAADVKSDTTRVIAPDSTRMTVPIERKTYLTADYRAVVEGFRPSLVELDLYRRTTLVMRETQRTLPSSRPKRWSAGFQAGWGITPHGAAPYIGVGVQYSVLTW